MTAAMASSSQPTPVMFLSDAEFRRVDHGGEAGEGAADDVDRELGAHDRQAHQRGRLFEAADRVDRATEARLVQDVGLEIKQEHQGLASQVEALAHRGEKLAQPAHGFAPGQHHGAVTAIGGEISRG